MAEIVHEEEQDTTSAELRSLAGQTGWYQDPKTRMAYYFVVTADGEWAQKIVLRCSALILSPYEMHEQILSKVFIQP
ncbi:hypothetical protein PINS_up019173 [Pythium insidiosum]|nr:hypothetical protein PINS_up019173 [Pythium insidiosum]